MNKRFLILFFVAAALLVGSKVSVWASACDADLEQYCYDVQPGAGALANCIHNYQDKFTASCRQQLQKIDDSVRRIGNACMDDARTFCRDVRPGYGRIKKCILDNRDKLTSSCQDALAAKGL